MSLYLRSRLFGMLHCAPAIFLVGDPCKPLPLKHHLRMHFLLQMFQCPSSICFNGYKDTNTIKFSHWCKCFLIVHSMFLRVSFFYQHCLVPSILQSTLSFTIYTHLHPTILLPSYRNQLPSLISPQGLHFFIHAFLHYDSANASCIPLGIDT